MLTTTKENQAAETLGALGDALSAGDIDRAVELFADTSYWRDILTFTWNIKTMDGKDAIRDMLGSQLALTKPSDWKVTEADPTEDDTVAAWITFETPVARGKGHIRLKDGKIFTLLTVMDELKGHEEPTRFRRALGAKHGHAKHQPTWKEEREAEEKSLGYETQPYVVIIGGGQGGIALAARLKQLGVPALIVEKNDRPGDSWRRRYKSLHLHDPVWYDHLPYMDFPKNWPIFPSKDKMGDWLEAYTKIMELNYWSRSTAKRASYDEASGTWTVVVDRDGEEVTLTPKQLVLATGMSGKPFVPEIKGAETFKGDIHHSSAHPGPDPFKGKRVVIIGANNSAHDIAAALWENDVAEVTMIQRSPTHIIKSETLLHFGFAKHYCETAEANGIDVEKSDIIYASTPYALMHIPEIPVQAKIRERDAALYQALEKAGFMLDWGMDDSGIKMLYLRRGSGYYIDVGASDLVADGSIKLKTGTEIQEITPEGVLMADGTMLPADVIVYATGYGSMNGFAADLISQDVADKVGKVWGLGSGATKDPGPWEGEQRNMWKPTQQEALWFHGGNLHQSRYHSQHLALQLKARMEGIPTPVYGLQEVYHKS